MRRPVAAGSSAAASSNGGGGFLSSYHSTSHNNNGSQHSSGGSSTASSGGGSDGSDHYLDDDDLEMAAVAASDYDDNNLVTTTTIATTMTKKSSSSQQQQRQRRKGNNNVVSTSTTSRGYNHSTSSGGLSSSSTMGSVVGSRKRRLNKSTGTKKLPINNNNKTKSKNKNSKSSKNKNKNNTNASSLLFTVLIVLFVVTDMIYLYRLSTQALYDNNNNSKPTHLSRIVNHHHQHKNDNNNNITGTTTTTTTSRSNDGKQHQNNNNNRSHKNKLYDDAVERGYRSLDDKERILEILQQAGLDVDDLDQETINELPTWTQVTELYGPQPYILGLEKCEEFVDMTDPTVRFFGIAGTFNSGTNLVHELMAQNCQITERMQVYGNESKGIRWQVPWGKHYPASHRGMHATKTDKVVPVENSLPLVAVRDPWMWLQSMCRHHYTAFWPHSEKGHCPNLVATDPEIEQFPRLKQLYYESNIEGIGEKVDEPLIPVTVKYDKDIYDHDSLAHFWSEWYRLYLDADFPRIMVRFEDMLFHAKEVIEQLCACGGGVPRDDRPPGRDFVHISESAKLGTAAHGKHKTNLLGAIIRYGTFEHRLDKVMVQDLTAGKKYFDTEIMETFGYRHPTPDDLTLSES